MGGTRTSLTLSGMALSMLLKLTRVLAPPVLVLSPIAVATLFVWAGRYVTFSVIDTAAILLLSLLVGSFGIWLIPIGRWMRIAAIALYLPISFVVTASWAFLFACGAYEMCL